MPTSSPRSEELRRFAEEPAAWGEIDPATGLTRLLTDRYCLLLGPVPSFTQVSRLRLDPEAVAETLAEVRATVAERGHRSATWNVASSASPGDLADRLVAHGLQPDDHLTSLVLTHEPPHTGIEARRIESMDEFLLAARISHEAFETAEDRRREWEEIANERFAAERDGRGPRVYLAFVDATPVGTASAIVEDGLPAALMIGGSVLPAYRGRGVYRALVRARWDDAVATGAPALCVQARATSRPILVGLGFDIVSEHEVLIDPATC